MKPEIAQAIANLQNRGFITHAFPTAAEMRDFVLSSISTKQSVGFGGSVTVINGLDLYSALKGRGSTVYSHWFCAPEERASTLQNAHTADVYLMSSNAFTLSGRLLNIDGNGNRLAALISGPQTVFILMGENKFALDDEAALKRVKTIACPKNARRIGLQTPCATLDYCTECSSLDRMCSYTLWLEHAPKNRIIHICIAEESLGY